ncbi:hypothetical protein [Amycolatopsis acididurans]|nr:hypothetical protein [Amycolatopsis acididurans]
MSLHTQLERLASAFWAHLRAHPLPDPCMVSLRPADGEVDVQVAATAAVMHLSELLVWAYTLESVTASWWRTDHGSLHLTVEGRAQGVRFHVYGGIGFHHCAGLVPLAVDASEGVSIDELYTLRDLLAQETEVAA